LVVRIGVADDFPEVHADLRAEVGELAASTQHAQNLKLFDTELYCRCLRDLVENVLNLRLLQMILTVVENLKDLQFIVTLCEVPELLEQCLTEQVFLQEHPKDVS